MFSSSKELKARSQLLLPFWLNRLHILTKGYFLFCQFSPQTCNWRWSPSLCELIFLGFSAKCFSSKWPCALPIKGYKQHLNKIRAYWIETILRSIIHCLILWYETKKKRIMPYPFHYYFIATTLWNPQIFLQAYFRPTLYDNNFILISVLNDTSSECTET